MNRYVLKTKEGEIVNKTIQFSLELAIEFFSLTKKLNPNQLLTIYKVEKDENWDRD